MRPHQVEALRAFTEAILREAYEEGGGDVDGAWLQEKGEELGVLMKTSPTEPCSEERCHCAEYYSTDEFEDGETTCYRIAPFVLGAAAPDPSDFDVDDLIAGGEPKP